MKKAVLIAWLLLPAGAAAYHYGPGQEALRLDDAGEAIERGREAAAKAQMIRTAIIAMSLAGLAVIATKLLLDQSGS